MAPIAIFTETDCPVPRKKMKYDIGSMEIESNTTTIPSSALDWLPSFPADTSDDVLRAELEEKGVLHVKGVMPRDFVLNYRERFFTEASPSGILAPGTKPVDGIYCGREDRSSFQWPQTRPFDESDRTNYALIAKNMHLAEWSHEFCSNKYLLDMVHRLQPHFAEPFCLRREIFRTYLPVTPGKAGTHPVTGVHYDQIYLRHGGPNTALTSWIPIGDVNPMEGGLIYLERSKEVGQELEDKFADMSREKGFTDEERKYAYNSNMTNIHGISSDAREFAQTEGQGRKWLVGDYEAGDAVFHHMYAIHAGGVNYSPYNRIRFSAHLRFADRQGDYDHRWDNPFIPGDDL